jgi:putative MATE family efflux protein
MSGPGARGGQRDLTEGPIGRTLLMFALPTLGANILQSLNASINMVWIGRFLGENALAATSNASIVMFLAFSAVFGFGMAATVLVGQHLGRRDIDGARRAIGAATGLFIVIAFAVAVIGYPLTDRLLHLLATPPEAMALASSYMHVIFLMLPGSFMLVLLMMSLRGAGDSMTPLFFMILSVALDAGLNPLLIAGIGPFPRMGIAGSAWATVVANYVSAAGLLAYVYARDLPIRLRGAEWRYLLPAMPLLRLIVGRGIAMGLQMLVFTLSAIVMIGLVNHAGVITTAAYGVAVQLWNYVQMPALAVGAAVSAMAAQNIGAGKWDRVNRITSSGIMLNILMTGSMLILLTIFDRPVLGLFMGHDSPSLPIAAHIQLVSGWSFLFAGISMVLFATMRANGVVMGPLIVMTIALLPGRVGFALGMRPWLGFEALWWSFPASSMLSLALAFIYFRHGKWRGQVFADQAELAEHPELVPPQAPAE